MNSEAQNFNLSQFQLARMQQKHSYNFKSVFKLRTDIKCCKNADIYDLT